MVNRKEKRKQERLEKKQRRSQKNQSKRPAPVETEGNKNGGKKRKVERPTQTSDKPSRGNGPSNKFHELLQETARSTEGGEDSPSAEDKEIAALEKKLGISSSSAQGKKKLQKEYMLDGLGDDFTDFLSSLDNISKVVKERSNGKAKPNAPPASEDESGLDEPDNMSDMSEDTRQEMLQLQAEEANFLQGMEDLPTDESDIEEEDEEMLSEPEDDEVAANTAQNQQLSGSESEEDEAPSDNEEKDASEEVEEEDLSEEEADKVAYNKEEKDESEEEVEEDIYGRPVLKKDNGEKKPSAYVPPHLRKQAASTKDKKTGMDEQELRELTRRINGQINRIAESNMEPICLELEKIYRSYPTSVVNDVLLSKIQQTTIHPRQLLTSLIKTCGALMSALFHSVGSQLGGFFLEKIVLKLHASVIENREKPTEEEESSKEPVNLLLLVCVLYICGVAHCSLIYDLFRSFVEHGTPLDIELIYHLLKHCGPQLRSDDNDSLREMVASVQENIQKQDNEERARYLLDVIDDLKKPGKGKHVSSSMDMTSLKKWIGRVKTRCGNSNSALRVSLDELLNADEKGRWWIVGGTWKPEAPVHEETKEQENELLQLASKMRMNTDVRKRIFIAIMGATDSLDAYERLLQLKLRDKQEREIVRVLLHCCASERQFNRYYLLLAQKLCELDPRYKFTFQLALWDQFKQFESMSQRKVYNVAQFLAGMVASASLSLSCLKVLDFTQLESNAVLFLRAVMEQLLKQEREEDVSAVFERLLQTKKAQLTLDGLAVFVHQHMDGTLTDVEMKRRLQSVRSLLDQLSKTAAQKDKRSMEI